ncbi:MAG: amidohydrolase family protein [Planctomycetes bacterium]|nr:amidohydrolase family protein [Planctomycetota bacterium]
MTVTGRHYATGERVRLEFAHGRIASISPATAKGTGVEPASNSEPWIAPGFVDLQINGFGGHEFNEPQITPQRVREIVLAQDQFGVTSFCPTTTTQSLDRLTHAMTAIGDACERWPEIASRVPGIHLEGPFICAEDGPRGAHPREHCRPPDWDAFRRLNDASGGRIRIVTIAADYDQTPEFTRRAVDAGIRIAIGHTGASSDQIVRTVDAGASFSTHLGNAAHPRIRRHPNYIWDQLADDRLGATLIVDGHHLPASVVKCFLRVKSIARCALISDITGMAGMPPGNYSGTPLGNIEVLDDGRLVVAGQRELLAGASLPIGHGVANVMKFAGLDLRDAVQMASLNAQRLAGFPVQPLEAGTLADLVLLHHDCEPGATSPLRIVATYKRGERTWDASRTIRHSAAD